MNARKPIRSFATAIVLTLLAGMAAAQCSSSPTSAAADAALLQKSYGVAARPAMSAMKSGAGAIVVKTAAVSQSNRIATAAPRTKAFSFETRSSQPGSEALYAALALMAAIALRRFGR